MRWILDGIAVLTLAGLIGAVIFHTRMQSEQDAEVDKVKTELRRLELEIKYRAVTESTETNEFGWPITIDPAWFGDKPPRNTLVTAGRPWVEVAPEEDSWLTHPRVRMTVDDRLAGFWYNPYQGIVRARVPVLVSDRDATEMYNRVNGSSMNSLLSTEEPPRREAGEESGKTATGAGRGSSISTKGGRR